MRIEYRRRNAEFTPRFTEHAEPRLATLERLFDRINAIRVTLSAQRNWRTVEITLEADGLLLRSEERSNDDLASFDKALDRLERQLRRYRERVTRRARKSFREVAADEAIESAGAEDEKDEEDEAGEVEIVRTKSHALKPMMPDEAALQMDLLGHDFFLFFDAESEQVEVVYRRRDGGYGLIEPAVG